MDSCATVVCLPLRRRPFSVMRQDVVGIEIILDLLRLAAILAGIASPDSRLHFRQLLRSDAQSIHQYLQEALLEFAAQVRAGML